MSKSVRSIRFQLVTAVNGVLLLFVVAFLIVDYGRELSQRTSDKKISLQEEAKTLLPGVIHLSGQGREVIQTYVDDVCGRMEAADSPSHHIAVEVGGDYFDILPHGEDAWLVCIADATDHGGPAAMTAAMLKTLLLQTKDHSMSPANILNQMNRVFMEVNLYGDFASVILLRIDLKERTLAYANAGHDPAWLIEDGSVRELLATGTLLGILDDGEWEDETIQLSDRCRIVLSTDGITETFNSEEKEFGKQRLLELLLRHSSISATETAERVDWHVNEFRGDAKQSDDVTLPLMDLVLRESFTARSVDSQFEKTGNNGQDIAATSDPGVADRNAKSAK